MKTITNSVYKCALILFLLAGNAFLSAQSAAVEIETLLETNAVTYAQAARFVLEASGVRATRNSEDAFNYAVQQNWLPGNVQAGDPARLDKISLFLMQSFNLKGGIFYSITNSPHYAYRELVYNGVIQGRSDPAMYVPGERLLFYVNRILSMIEAMEMGA